MILLTINRKDKIMIDYLTFIEELKTIKQQVMQHGITNYPHIDALIKKYEDRVKANEEVSNA